ncbi:MAG TPA: NAD(+)/NADH kinase [Candidatus Limnocylindrales bacterium]|nr:NAD(+)/NADH kinase [Candidatus Limnocylindrales bacterium]
MKDIGLVPNWHKKNTAIVVDKIRHFFEQRNIKIKIADRTKTDFYSDVSLAEQLSSWHGRLELIIVVGGDGTILRVARDLACWNVPVLGINLGQKGFLAEIEVEQTERYLQYIATKQYSFRERMMLEARLLRGDEELGRYCALNDIVVARGPFSRIIKIDADVNNDFMESYSGDGVIIATPTGSTGYSLSAGGPIVNPTMELFVVTPICPHSLYNRSVILNGSDTMKLHVDSRQVQVVLTVDGQVRFALEDKDQIIVTRADQKVRLVCFHDNSFYRLLHQKLKG